MEKEVVVIHNIKCFDVPKPKKCQICGVDFMGRGKSRFCGNACRCKAYRLRKEAKCLK